MSRAPERMESALSAGSILATVLVTILPVVWRESDYTS